MADIFAGYDRVSAAGGAGDWVLTSGLMNCIGIFMRGADYRIRVAHVNTLFVFRDDGVADRDKIVALRAWFASQFRVTDFEIGLGVVWTMRDDDSAGKRRMRDTLIATLNAVFDTSVSPHVCASTFAHHDGAMRWGREAEQHLGGDWSDAGVEIPYRRLRF